MREISAKVRARMVPATLHGAHEHQTTCGKRVQIWHRGDRYLARGRHNGRQFGETLSGDQKEAASGLRRLLVSIEDGTFQPASERRRLPVKTGSAPRLSVRELCERFLTGMRQLRGKKTFQDYRVRLVPLIELTEHPDVKRRYPLAVDVDRDFAIVLRTTLHSRMVTRNGHPGAVEKRVSPRQIYNVLDCVRTLFNWTKKLDVNLLPISFVNPFSKEIVGEKAQKDPLRPIPIPLEQRVKLVKLMDAWPFPSAIEPLLRRCVAGRADGPLLRRRAIFAGRSQPNSIVNSVADVVAHFDTALQRSPEGEVQAAQDSKRLFRRVLREMGGVSEDELAREFKRILAKVTRSNLKRFYDLRASCCSDLERSGVSHLVQRYVTGHTTDDILFEYNSLDPVSEMQKYFVSIELLFTTMTQRGSELGLHA